MAFSPLQRLFVSTTYVQFLMEQNTKGLCFKSIKSNPDKDGFPSKSADEFC